MKINKKLLFGIIILAVFFLLTVIFAVLQKPPLVTGEIEEVIQVEVNYYGEKGAFNALLSKDKDKELIIKLYDSVRSTKDIVSFQNPREYERQESDPKFTIKFFYNNGMQDLIYPTETGGFLYRYLNASGWVGGKNNNILDIVDGLR